MLALTFLALVGLSIVPWWLCGRGTRTQGLVVRRPPLLTESKKRRTRLQQTRRHGARRF